MDLERRIGQLEERVAALEARPAPAAVASLDLLDGFRARVADERAKSDHPETAGTVGYLGAVSIGEREYLYAKEHRVHDLVGTDWTAAATTLGSLGSPARLALLAALLAGARTRAELQQASGDTSTGHLYHHLRDLQAAGLLHQPRRGEYELAANALVPLLAVVAAALDLAGSSNNGSGSDSEPTERENDR